MPEIVRNDRPPEGIVPHHAVWRRSPLKALLGSFVVSGLLFYIFTYLASIAVQNASFIQNGSNMYLFPIINFTLLCLWIVFSTWLLKRLGWQSPWIALLTMIVIIVAAAYNVTNLGQTVVTYPVGMVIGAVVLMIYYFLFVPRTIIWIALPVFLLFFVGYQINQRISDNQTIQFNAAQNVAANYQYPIYFTTAIPSKRFLVQHFFWDPAKQNIRFITEGNVAINEYYSTDPQQNPPITCGTSSCVDLGVLKQGQHIYTDKNNPYNVEYYTMFDNTLIRLTSDKNQPVTKAEAIFYLNQLKQIAPEQLFGIFDRDYFLSQSYYYIPKQVFNQETAGYSVTGETNF